MFSFIKVSILMFDNKYISNYRVASFIGITKTHLNQIHLWLKDDEAIINQKM